MSAPRRNTWQREAVRARLAEAQGFVSAQQLYAVLRDEGSTIGLATVYRNLAQLAESGEADSLLNGQLVHTTRQHLGRQLAREAHAPADIVVPVPDSGTPHAIGYAQ